MKPDTSFLKGLFSEYLLNSKTRLPIGISPAEIRLDRNESVFDIRNEIKSEILGKVLLNKWNHYPPPYYAGLEKCISEYAGVNPEQVVTAAGSAAIITTLFNYFAINRRQIVVAQPSFTLYDYHCNTYGISFDAWNLDKNLEYDVSVMPKLKPYSLVVFASPNNPVGNIIQPDDLEQILKKNPTSIFLIDEVYHEFSGTSVQKYINQYPNLLLLRSFSKTFSAAGLRMGYVLGNQSVIEQIRKLILTFSLNYLSVQFISTLLSNMEYIDEIRKNIRKTVEERNKTFYSLSELSGKNKKFVVKQSYGNFLLIQFHSAESFDVFRNLLAKEQINLLDVSGNKRLPFSFRFTIGTPSDNELIVRLLMLV